MLTVSFPLGLTVMCRGGGVENRMEECGRLHERWQQQQKQFWGAGLADTEHRIMLAEDSLKRSRPSPQLGPAALASQVEKSYAHRSLRDRLEEVRTCFTLTTDY